MEDEVEIICMKCSTPISQAEFTYSIEEYEIPLCYEHQGWFEDAMEITTFEAVLLYLMLGQNNIDALMEVDDGHKSIDLVVETAKLHIEVDGDHHNTDPSQAFSDLQRTYYSLRDGYITLRIPNILVTENLSGAMEYIIAIINERTGMRH